MIYLKFSRSHFLSIHRTHQLTVGLYIGNFNLNKIGRKNSLWRRTVHGLLNPRSYVQKIVARLCFLSSNFPNFLHAFAAQFLISQIFHVSMPCNLQLQKLLGRLWRTIFNFLNFRNGYGVPFSVFCITPSVCHL